MVEKIESQSIFYTHKKCEMEIRLENLVTLRFCYQFVNKNCYLRELMNESSKEDEGEKIKKFYWLQNIESMKKF